MQLRGLHMKKLAFLLLLLATPCYAPITIIQTKTIRDQVSKMMTLLYKMDRLAAATAVAINAGNAYTTDFSTTAYTLTTAQQTDIVNSYNDLKTKIQTEYNALP